jgi:hypothetical protein
MTLREIVENNKLPVRVVYTGEKCVKEERRTFYVYSEKSVHADCCAICDVMGERPQFLGYAHLDEEDYELYNPIEITQGGYDKIVGWIERGDVAFHFVNQDFGSNLCGHGFFLCYGREYVERAVLGETRAPDTQYGAGWRYILDKVIVCKKDLLQLEMK